MFILFILVVLLAGVFFVVTNSSAVQTKLGQWVAGSLSNRLNAKVMVDKIDIDFINRLTLDGFVVFDQQNDTLMYAKRINLTVRRLGIRSNTLRFGDLELDNARVNLRRIDEKGGMNLDFITEYFSTTDTENVDSVKTDLLLTAKSVILRHCSFSYSNPYNAAIESGLDFNNISVQQINGNIEDFIFINDSLNCEFESFSFREKSGMALTNLTGALVINEEGIHTTDLELTTPTSAILGDIALRHDSWADYQDFLSSINWRTHLNRSTINLKDIGYFVPQLYNVDFPIYIEGKISGAIDNLKGREMRLTAGNRSIFRGDFDISGLPDAQNAFIDLRIKQLSSDYSDLAEISSGLSSDPNFGNNLPVELQRAGSLFFEGSFTGFPNDFVAYGNLTTEAGAVKLDLNVEEDTLNNGLSYGGGISTQNLDVGRVFAIKEFGTVAVKADVTAFSKEKLQTATVNGQIERMEYAGYNYRNILVDGKVASKKFEGKLTSRDPNVDFRFQGIIDFSRNEPILDFDAEVINIDLTTLKLVKTEEPLSFSTRLSLNAIGKSVNDIAGSLSAYDTFICFGDSLLYLDEIKLSAVGGVSNRKISFTSDVVDINLTGAFDVSELPQSFQNLIAEVLPAVAERKKVKNEQNFEFSLSYKEKNLITGLLMPELEIAVGTMTYGSYNSLSRSFSLFLRSSYLGYKEYIAQDITADMGKVSEILKGKIYAASADIQKLHLENLDIDLEAYNDIGEIGIGWFNSDRSTQADLQGQITFGDKRHSVIELKPGYLGSENSLWKIERTAYITLDSTRIQVDSLLFANHDQRLEIEGVISNDKEDELIVTLENFDFSSLDSLGIDMNKSLRGKLNLNGSLRDFYDERIVKADLTIDSLGYGEYELGNVNASSRYLADVNSLSLVGSLVRESEKILDFKGDYLIGKENPLHGILFLNDFNLGVLNAFSIPEVTDYSGFANGQIGITGDITAPSLDGYIDFQDAIFKINYLNTYYRFNERVRVEDGWFGIDYKPIYDESGHKGYVVASAFHEDYKNWSYDISIEANNFFLLNTTRDMNSTYYGTAYGTGTMQIGGYEGFLEINIDAITEKGTSVKLPLDETEDVTMENFVHFISKKGEEQEERQLDLSGVQLRLNVDATPDAEIQLIFDEKAGDIIRGRGSGKITLEISPTGEFLMFGRYEIQEGSYLFTLQNLINKQFKLREGGVIGWYGDPYQADIDITATYNLRTPLYPIMIENQDRYRGREEVNVVLNLNGKLMNPEINFEIELPAATETERSQLSSIASTTQQLNQQVFSLLILNRFLPVQTTDNQALSGVSGFGAATTSDFVSSQISSWLSELSNEFDIGVNYRPGDQISNQEIAVALSTQLFNERLSVRGNFGVTSATESQYNPSQTSILGDFLVEYSLTKDGKIRLKVFNETNPYEVFSTSSSIYTQGVGLIYQEDFDTLDEFFDEIKGLFSNDKVEAN